jgi:hypothetical protein
MNVTIVIGEKLKAGEEDLKTFDTVLEYPEDHIYPATIVKMICEAVRKHKLQKKKLLIITASSLIPAVVNIMLMTAKAGLDDYKIFPGLPLGDLICVDNYHRNLIRMNAENDKLIASPINGTVLVELQAAFAELLDMTKPPESQIILH